MPDYYTRLLELRRAEGSAHGLAKLPNDFYPQTRAYLGDLRSTFEGELRENPSGRKGEIARQTHHRAAQTARDIVEARMMKVANAALQASLGGNPELPNALPEERALHDALVGALRQHRAQVAPYLDGGSPAPAAGPARAPAPAQPVGRRAVPADETPPPPAPSGASGARVVRMLLDTPSVALGPETLALRKDDLVSLPADVAALLVDGHAAEPVQLREGLPGAAPASAPGTDRS